MPTPSDALSVERPAATASDDPGRHEEETTSESESDSDEEPLLLYQRLGSATQNLLDTDGASCVSVSGKVLAIGTHEGKVHVFDTLGHIEVKSYSSHSSTVNDIGFDEHCEYLASCSDDGTVVIVGLYSEERFKQEYRRPVKTVALDPKFRAKKSRQFVSGGLAGQLVLNTKGWLGTKDYALHSGEGTIHAARWTGSLIAWANDIGVRIYDCVSHQCIKYINRPKGSPRADLFRASLFWQSESLLIVGWADSVTILRISVQESPIGDAFAGPGATSSAQPSSGSTGLPVFRNVQVVASFQTDYYISGIAPFGPDLVALAYVIDQDDNMLKLAEVQEGATYQRRRSTVKGSLRPEVRVITWMNEELASDALTIHGYEHYNANDYLMASYYSVPASGADFLYGSASSDESAASERGAAGTTSRRVGGSQWWTEGDEPMYYIVSPRDIVLARPRGPDDRIQWLLENKKFEEALSVLETSEGKNLKDSTMEQIGFNYLTHLFEVKDFAKAAALCPKLLFQKTALWERWVLEFAKVQQLALLCRYIPTGSPRLRQAVYDMVLKIFLQSDHENFLYLVRRWPAEIYGMREITDSLLAYEARSAASGTLREALAELYILQDRKDMALGIFLQLQRPEVFDFIARNGLLPSVRDKVVLMMELDSGKSIDLLVEGRDLITPPMVVSQLKEAEGARGKAGDKFRMFLHQYLHQLFERDPDLGAQCDLHGMQVELYAEYDPKLLMNFLATSSSYPLEVAYAVCREKSLYQELVFVLGRMGNASQGVSILVQKLGDIQGAIQFVQSQRDDELWEQLVEMSLASPRLIGTLLENLGSAQLDASRVLKRIPLGMPIPQLRDRLIKVLEESRTQASLIQGANEILIRDRASLLQRLHREARRAVPRERVAVGKK